MTPNTRKVITVVSWSVGAALILAFGLSMHAALRENQEISYMMSDKHQIEEAQASVRQKLKDPTSALFTEERVLGEGAGRRVCGQVNAKNSYGAYAGAERFVVIYGVSFIGNERPPEAFWSRPEHPCDVF